MYAVKILADSIAPNGCRLTTMEVTLPRIMLAELNTHRMFSRNSASSRAIPVEKTIKRVLENPFVPEYWGANQKGMQAERELTGWRRWLAPKLWVGASRVAVLMAKIMLKLGLHKQLTNRILEPWMWHTVIVSATEWGNFFGLRCHPAAQPEIRRPAEMMREALANSTPTFLMPGEWHMPITDDIEELVSEGYELDDIKKISIGRCARVSFLTHFGIRDPKEDVGLFNKLKNDRHMSPLEHVATPSEDDKFHGNFKGFIQYRKEVPGEADFSRHLLEA